MDKTYSQKWNLLFKNTNSITLSIFKKNINMWNLKNNFKIVNVVGTNGKGSISHFLNQGLIENNYKVGLFTSPHLFTPNERILVNNQNISNYDFFKISDKMSEMNFFSKILLTAMIYFNQKKVDIAILEAGIGGKHDLTKAFSGNIGVVTSIGKDHMNLLGKTKQTISKNKAGIINSSMNFYIPNSIPKYLQKIFMNKASKTYIVDNKNKSFIEENKKLAAYILKNEFNIIKNNFILPKGRVMIIKKQNKKHILDVGHNKEGIKKVINWLKLKNINYENIIISMLKRKNIIGIERIFPKDKKIYYFKLNNEFHDFPTFIKVEKLKNINENTLFIGSFKFIDFVYKKIFND